MHSSSSAAPGLPPAMRVVIKGLALALVLAGVLLVCLSPQFVR
jgi:hypothetical protein